MKAFYRNTVCASGIAIALSACATDQISREESGTLIGAGAGAAIGAAVSSDGDRAKGVIIGALIGGILGNRIGAMLDERDRMALEQKVLDAAATGTSGDPVTWYSDHSGASAVITPIGPTNEQQKSVRVIREADVRVATAPLEAVSGSRVVTESLNLRQGPGTAFEIKRVLKKGAEYSVLGRTRNDWYLLSENGVAIGYASGAFLGFPGSRRIAAVDSIEKAPESSSMPHEPPGPVASNTSEIDLTVTQVCRRVIVKFRGADGKVGEEEADTCQTTEGEWGA